MTVYKIFDDAQRFATFHIDMEEFLDAMDPRIGEQAAMQFSQDNLRLADYWQPLTVTLRANEGADNELPDISLWRGASCILSDRALTILGEELAAFGELLPLTFQSREFALFNCLTQVDADAARVFA